MQIIVCVKPVFNTKENIIIKNSNCILPPQNDYMINPFDEYAIEEALKIKDKNADTNILSVSYGEEKAESVVRFALALGVDRAVFTINTKQYFSIDSLRTAKILYDAIKNESFDCILMGKESSDLQNGAVGPILAAMLNIPIVTNVHHCIFTDDRVEVERYSSNCILQKLYVDLPCIITVTKGINIPRLATLKGIMSARNKPVLKLSEANFTDDYQISPVKYSYKKSRLDCQFISGDEKQIVSQIKDILGIK